jgi:hypothetical protein
MSVLRLQVRLLEDASGLYATQLYFQAWVMLVPMILTGRTQMVNKESTCQSRYLFKVISTSQVVFKGSVCQWWTRKWTGTGGLNATTGNCNRTIICSCTWSCDVSVAGFNIFPYQAGLLKTSLNWLLLEYASDCTGRTSVSLR